jgi:molybdopterin-containing oxidoreductase family iron-sulfur binding subunit
MPSDRQLISIPDRVEITRRDTLKLIAGGIAALGAGCLEPPGQEIVPWVVEPPEARPSGSATYATALVLDGYAYGVLAGLHEGRATKLDGNPAHPMMRGGSTPWMQARILDLYDPQRAREVTSHGGSSAWELVARELGTLRGPVWLVMPPTSSTSLDAMLQRARERVELHVVYEAPLGGHESLRGTQLVFGEPVEILLDLARADVIAALDADFALQPAWARAFAARHTGGDHMNRLWVCEPMLTPTGTVADHQLAVPAGDVAAVALIVLDQLRRRGLGGPSLPHAMTTAAAQRLGERAGWALALADDLAAHKHAGAVVVGQRQPAIVHALARWIDAVCGNAGRAVTYTTPALLDPLGGRTLAELAAAKPNAVIVVDANPAYTAPHHELFGAPYTLYAGLWGDETASACRTCVPLAHDLEAWGDARALDGTRSVVQPVMRPRFTAISALELVAALAGVRIDPRTFVQQSLKLDDKAWRHGLAAGLVDGTASPPRTLEPRELADLEHALTSRPPRALEIDLAPSVLHDGRFSGNAWLQELPHPITKQTWGNAAVMSRATADALDVDDGEVVRVGDTVELPVLVAAEHADGAVTIALGYGRAAPRLPVAYRVGTDAFPLATTGAIAFASVIAIGCARRIVRTQHHMHREGRELAPVVLAGGSLEAVEKLRGPQPTLIGEPVYPGLHWAMTIDTSICTGCSACMVACQAENNIATVGPDDVARGRHMNWLRIDRYVDPQVNQPMLCQHCETAPCEYVCPVQATVHSDDGLNEMVYNRCVGTRFCSNNCPYKVRRFNWFAYERHDESALQYNPDVTVRSRGVMEKCTYCVQRIRGAEIRSHVEHRDIRPGEVQTACQQACPTGAIQFGPLEHTDMPVAIGRRDPRMYSALFELGTRPRTRYLARVVNPKVGT